VAGYAETCPSLPFWFLDAISAVAVIFCQCNTKLKDLHSYIYGEYARLHFATYMERFGFSLLTSFAMTIAERNDFFSNLVKKHRVPL
jgi:hypothetical protein